MTQTRKSWLRAWTVSVFVVVCFVAARPALAQTGTAALVGEVTDPQKQVLPGATVTVTNAGTAASQVTTTDERGSFRLSNVQPGMYTLRVELAGFKTAIVERVSLQVDSVARESVTLELGGVTETVSVVSETTHLNTTDASIGNVMSRERFAACRWKRRTWSICSACSPGPSSFPPATPRRLTRGTGRCRRARRPAERYARWHRRQRPANQTAYTSAIRMTQEALQEFRVSTRLQRRDGPLERPQVSLITRSGTNQFDGSGYWNFRRTATSTNEYFLELSQVAAGQESKAPKLDKDIYGGSIGGPISRNRLFFFANLEQLKEQSESPVTRNVPSNSMRDGVLITVRGGASARRQRQGPTGSHSVEAGWYA